MLDGSSVVMRAGGRTRIGTPSSAISIITSAHCFNCFDTWAPDLYIGRLTKNSFAHHMHFISTPVAKIISN